MQSAILAVTPVDRRADIATHEIVALVVDLEAAGRLPAVQSASLAVTPVDRRASDATGPMARLPTGLPALTPSARAPGRRLNFGGRQSARAWVGRARGKIQSRTLGRPRGGRSGARRTISRTLVTGSCRVLCTGARASTLLSYPCFFLPTERSRMGKGLWTLSSAANCGSAGTGTRRSTSPQASPRSARSVSVKQVPRRSRNGGSGVPKYRRNQGGAVGAPILIRQRKWIAGIDNAIRIRSVDLSGSTGGPA